MAATISARVAKRRTALRLSGLRPVQIWVPDTRQPNFANECRRQSQLVSKADLANVELHQFMDAALADVDGWTE
jgi:hypothetical protein